MKTFYTTLAYPFVVSISSENEPGFTLGIEVYKGKKSGKWTFSLVFFRVQLLISLI